jgi:phosphotransferase system  glucose/maltose/N-acetylglucosamine-specific IIC component
MYIRPIYLSHGFASSTATAVAGTVPLSLSAVVAAAVAVCVAVMPNARAVISIDSTYCSMLSAQYSTMQ